MTSINMLHLSECVLAAVSPNCFLILFLSRSHSFPQILRSSVRRKGGGREEGWLEEGRKEALLSSSFPSRARLSLLPFLFLLSSSFPSFDPLLPYRPTLPRKYSESYRVRGLYVQRKCGPAYRALLLYSSLNLQRQY